MTNIQENILSPKQSWSIIKLCYNEAETIETVVSKATETLKIISNGTYEIIIVDDGSTDGSKEKIISLKDKNAHVRYIIHPNNLGIGMGLRSGYFSSVNENVVFVPGDDQYDIRELIPYSVFNDDEIICYYRKENTHYSFFRNILSLANKIFNILFLGLNLKDVNWVKIYKTKWLYKLDLRTTSSLIESEICAKLVSLGIKPIQVQSKYLKREKGKSKGSNFSTVLRAVKDMFKLTIIVIVFKLKRSKK